MGNVSSVMANVQSNIYAIIKVPRCRQWNSFSLSSWEFILLIELL